MDFKRLRYFLAVAEGGSFSEAARRLSVVQPALSQQIGRLEAELGVSLLERSSRGVTLTEQGRILQSHAAKILTQVANTQAAVRDSARGYARSAAIAMPSSIAALLGVPLFAALKGRDRPIALTVFDNYVGFTERGLETGALNCALTTEPFNPERFESSRFATEKLLLIESNPAQRDEHGVSVRDLSGTPLLLPPMPNQIRMLVQQAFDECGLEMILAGEFRSLTTLLAGVSSHIAATILPISGIGQHVTTGELSARPISDYDLKRELFITLAHSSPADRDTTQIVVDELVELSRRLISAGLWPNARLLAKQ